MTSRVEREIPSRDVCGGDRSPFSWCVRWWKNHFAFRKNVSAYVMICAFMGKATPKVVFTGN